MAAAANDPRRRIVTTQYVLAEVLNHFAAGGRAARAVAADLVGSVSASRYVDVVVGDEALFQSALALYRARPDKAWSLVDCASFVVCERDGITEALAYDHHFSQAGLRPLLRDG